MATVDKKGKPINEYPKLVVTPKGKVRVLSKEEEDKVLGVQTKETKENKKGNWT